ncbi:MULTISPECIES: sugar phosphate isomerase/epimerase [unclassified Spirosoma]|uniref:sugar phosphate isomerase/epimerase family protein n=1 Tax=unclassified Spirosoma TaxID=2621999 RepID=UPI000968D1D5|nr:MULTISPECIES: sugar phosphate isomerase/epimerase [unclassified Spirosoma]MBN8825682.1 sugar phosphate isomerase/epimerase [Spirosoma sp.]OJW76623.1 MAG: xylose isomerase [Spirosoma sp. 48-14]
MELLFFCPRWGQEHVPWASFLEHVKDAGYQGVEASLPASPLERDTMLNELARQGLRFIGQHWETVCPDFNQHYREYEQRLRALASTQPMFINSQTGKDYYSFEQNECLIALATSIADETGIPILHETHRGKFSFAAHITRTYLERLPSVRIALDLSHWFTTAETFLQDQPNAVSLAISRTDHIHSRVGHTQGPQIADPRAPEWQSVVDHHLACWDRVIASRLQAGHSVSTITPEFGASPYLFLQPYTRQPVVDQWEVNRYMMEMLRARYQ